jgi:hypothetical protein
MLTGLIWTIQLVHYPSFSLVGKEECLGYQKAHQRRISYLVIPLMLAELALAIWLVSYDFYFDPQIWLKWISVVCVGLLWLLTAAVFAPLHSRMTNEGYTEKLTRQLVRLNWVRTAIWTIRLLSVLGLSALYV